MISKQGKADLRYALYQAAFIASTRNKDFIFYFAKQLQGREKERGIKTKRFVKLAAKLLVIAWTDERQLLFPINDNYFSRFIISVSFLAILAFFDCSNL